MCMRRQASEWWVYIVRCADGSLYTGIAVDVIKRVFVHNSGKGAAYTRCRLPVELVYQEKGVNRSEVSKREWEIKQLSREEKLGLIAAG